MDRGLCLDLIYRLRLSLRNVLIFVYLVTLLQSNLHNEFSTADYRGSEIIIVIFSESDDICKYHVLCFIDLKLSTKV